MDSSFQHRRLRYTFKMASGSFSKEGDPDTYVFEDYRSELEVESNGGYEFSTCKLRLFGIDQTIMNRLFILNYQNIEYMRNALTIEATNNNGEFAVIFVGEIFLSMADYTGAPDVPLIVEARSGLITSLTPPEDNPSYPGAYKVSDMMRSLAYQLGLDFENAGVEETLTDQYLWGSPIQKIQSIAQASRIQYWYLPERNLLVIAPMGSARTSVPVEVNLETGLVGWPTKVIIGVEFTSLFNPAIAQGCLVFIDSDVPSCNGEFYIIRLSHKLSSEIPGGPWFSYFTATTNNLHIVR